MVETRSAHGELSPNCSQAQALMKVNPDTSVNRLPFMDMPRRGVNKISMHMRSSEQFRQAMSHSPTPCSSPRDQSEHRRSLTARGTRISCASFYTGGSKTCSSPRQDSGAKADAREWAPFENIHGLPRRKVTEFSARMQKGESVRESLSHSPVCYQRRKPAASLQRTQTARHELTGGGSVLTGHGELCPTPRPIDVHNDVPSESVHGLPRRKVTEFSACMQKSDGVRESFSHSPVRCKQRKPAASLKRSQTARHELTGAETVLTGHGERCSTPRRLRRLDGEGMAVLKRNRASFGFWRQLPIYNTRGHIETTDCSQLLFSSSPGKAGRTRAHWQTSGAAAKDLLALSPRMPGNMQQTAPLTARLSASPRCSIPNASGPLPDSSSDMVKAVKPEHAVTINAARRVGHISRSAAVALSAAARASNVAAEAARLRCLAKFERLCQQTPRTGNSSLASPSCNENMESTQVSQKLSGRGRRRASYVADNCLAQCLAQSDSPPGQSEHPRCRQIPHLMPSNVLGQNEDVSAGRLVPAEPVARASRTWQFKQDLAKRGDMSAHALTPDKTDKRQVVANSASYLSVLPRQVKKADASGSKYPCLLASRREPDPEMGTVVKSSFNDTKNAAKTESTATPQSTGDLHAD